MAPGSALIEHPLPGAAPFMARSVNETAVIASDPLVFVVLAVYAAYALL